MRQRAPPEPRHLSPRITNETSPNLTSCHHSPTSGWGVLRWSGGSVCKDAFCAVNHDEEGFQLEVLGPARLREPTPTAVGRGIYLFSTTASAIRRAAVMTMSP